VRYRAFGLLVSLAVVVSGALPAAAQDVVVRGETVHTMNGPAIADGIVVIRDGKIAAVGPASEVQPPEGVRVLRAQVVTPGLIDAHTVVGLTGYLNQDQDQDQLDRNESIQPELRALDAYNAREALVEWVRNLGVTTLHTGHAPAALVPGQTMIVKTAGNTVDDATVVPVAMIAVVLGSQSRAPGDKSPGTVPKAVSMVRQALLDAQAYMRKQAAKDEDDEDDSKNEKKDNPAERNLRHEAFASALRGEVPLLVTAHRARDIVTTLRLAEEFGFRLVLDGAAEAYLVMDQIKAAGVPVIVHPTMARTWGDRENASFETAATLAAAGISVAMQSGYESYVPKTRIVLFEAAIAAANGLSFEQALGTMTIDAAKILGIDGRVGSLAVGKDGDVALFDGDPFEYTSHCVGVVIDGRVASDSPH